MFADLYDFQRKIGYLAITRCFSVEGAEPDQDLEILTDVIEDEDDVGMIGCLSYTTAPNRSRQQYILPRPQPQAPL